MKNNLVFFILLMTVFNTTIKADSRDPFENVNRAIFEFNMTLDEYFLKPVAIGYREITPSFVREGVHNVFLSFGEVPNAANSVLQGKIKNAGKSVFRFTINLTLGFFFLFDVASELGVTSDKEDFGQTLAKWGVPQGPYVVAPLFGPFTMRSGVGTFVDIMVFDPIFVDNVATRNSLFSLRTTDARANLLDAEQLIIGDPYLFIRNLYLQQRDFEVKDGKVKDQFGESDSSFDDDWLE